MRTHPSLVDWIISKHKDTNHMYDDLLPYEFHLRLVVITCHDFEHLLPDEPYEVPIHSGLRGPEPASFKEVVEIACWGHDLIEDTRCSYNDVNSRLGSESAELIYALTNEKGRNRAERGNANYYKGIIETKGGIFCKLCDRIANVRYSKMMKSGQFAMYRKENEAFMNKVHADEYPEMRDHLISLFADVKEHQKVEL